MVRLLVTHSPKKCPSSSWEQNRREAKGTQRERNNEITDLGEASVWDSFLWGEKRHQFTQVSICITLYITINNTWMLSWINFEKYQGTVPGNYKVKLLEGKSCATANAKTCIGCLEWPGTAQHFYPLSCVPHIEMMSCTLTGFSFQWSNHCRNDVFLKRGFFFNGCEEKCKRGSTAG